ncbi:F-box/FBD/LRR-repeat protein At1g80470-like [Trifolium pratense]|uniref:F-box/FBD/LRR-repeat protein At1g80470-like n=1 Tax=Trifolium pratense TaxID=57577 RepID=UPI001E6900AB|nr:F-box/FBD/LRR-repeat protein At1g80470-like [Trifolium pratense]
MKRKRHNDDDKEEEDRLSDLSDCVLLRILSLLNTKQAVQTCILSTRWKYLWKHLSNLKLHSSYFDTMDGFTEFAAQILSLRGHSTSLYSLKFYSDSMVQPHLIQRILKYVVSHDVQRFQLNLLYSIEHIPSCIFSCHTLTSLMLYVRHSDATILFPDSLNLPALTKLSLWNFVFPIKKDGLAEPFSTLKKLNNLTIRSCQVLHAQNLCISSITLVHLKIQTHKKNYGEVELYTPSLSTFAYAGIPFEKLCGSHLRSIKHVIIDAYMYVNNAEPPSNLLSWLKEFTEITSLTVTLTTLEVLSLVPNLLKVNFHSLRNLETLQVKKKGVSSGLSTTPMLARFSRLPMYYQDDVAKFRDEIFKEGSLSIPDKIVSFLLQNSPSAKVHKIY